MHYDLKTKSFAMTDLEDLEVTRLIHLRPSMYFHTPFLAAKRPQLWLESVPFHGTHYG
jgi:hypothetical protein